MKFLHPEHITAELTYDDVCLVPQYSEIASRTGVDLTPAGRLPTTIPVVVANMNAVAGKRMSETVARRGGMVNLAQDMDPDVLSDIVSSIKKCHPVFETPIVLGPDDVIQTALNLIGKRAHGAVVIVDDARRPVGIFTEKDVRTADRFVALKRVMRTDLVTVPDHLPPRELFARMDQERVSLAPVVKSDGTLAGVITKKGIVRSTLYSPAVNGRGELATCATIGINRDIEKRVAHLLEVGVDCIVLDTAHGHQARMIEALRRARAAAGPAIPLVAGNVVTAAAVRDLVAAGANIIKVGVGPGAMCTTRMMTGNGRPQFSAVWECASEARKLGAQVWADGGVRHPRDVALALAAGASHVMIGSWLAGTHESVGDLLYDEQGRAYKENFGMASRRAVVDRNDAAAIFEQARREYFEEGISTSRMYLQKGMESAEDVLDKITSGVRSACAYAGAANLEEFYARAVCAVQTRAGYEEGRPVATSW